MTIRERFNWMLRMSLMLFVLASVAFLSALTAMRYAVQGREVEMPDLSNQRAAVAQQMLQQRRLGIKIEDKVYSPLPIDTVVRQSPPAKTTVKTGQLAHVVLSLGPQKQNIPDLQNRSVRAARIELLQGGLQAGEISNAYLPGTQDDTVLLQDPAPGSSDLTSPHVNLLVSLGSRPVAYVMPDLVGLPLSEAMARVNSAGLKLGKVNYVAALAAPAMSIVAQNPLRGRHVDANTPIELQVAQ